MKDGSSCSDSATAAYKENLAGRGLFPAAIRSQLAYQAHQMKASTTAEKTSRASEVRCPHCHIVLSPELGTCRLLLGKRRKNTRRAELLTECLGCAASLRCGMLPCVTNEREEFAFGSSAVESKKSTPAAKHEKNVTPISMATPPVKKIGSSIKKRSGVRKLERLVAFENSTALETPKTSLSAFLSSLK
ncbi:hypothetical protein QR680_017530 [Steinernema hermaphroditum]|uniref:Uncharacterized protein n=1 Tax=Steinernema hermaphroditum TaxID=289476 RepID=A0AA39HGY5_9BILA|nr:hypothetical protein QR680_017530 [Steinernema hermaphroditum]